MHPTWMLVTGSSPPKYEMPDDVCAGWLGLPLRQRGDLRSSLGGVEDPRRAERSRLVMKVLSWMIALAGLWEFADIAALFVPDFGKIPDFLWNHIIIGFLLMIVGVWAARTSNAGTARRLHWIAAGTGIGLMISSLMLRYPVTGAGLWNDLIVGATAFVLGVGAALSSPRATG